MYNEIEQLEENLRNRKPASEIPLQDYDRSNDSLSYQPQKDIFFSKYEDARKPNSKEGDKFLPSGGAPGSVVGAVPADYSGYDDLLTKLNGLKPRDTSTADLINMGVSTGIGLLGGRFGTAAKVAGNYGMDRFNKAEKRSDSIEDAIIKLQADRAAKMAAGKKGTKVGGGGAGSAELRKWTDDEGNVRLSQLQDKNSMWVRDGADPVFKDAPIQTRDLQKPGGGSEQVFTRGNIALPVGGQLPQLKTEKNAKGEMSLLNDRTGQVKDLGDYFNKTGAGLSPHSDTAYKSISDQKTADPLLKGLEGSYNDMSLGMTAIGRGDIAGALAATKMAASSLEKGRMTSDKDLAQVSSINLGVAKRMESMLASALEGGKLTEDNRRELESLFSMIEANSRDAYTRRVGVFNKKSQTMLGKEWRPDLAFTDLPKFTGKKQERLIETSMGTAKDVMSTGEFIQPLVINGQPVMRDGKPVKAIHIMKNGKPFAIREAK